MTRATVLIPLDRSGGRLLPPIAWEADALARQTVARQRTQLLPPLGGRSGQKRCRQAVRANGVNSSGSLTALTHRLASSGAADLPANSRAATASGGSAAGWVFCQRNQAW
jgi:hypothetical protein